MSKKVSSKSSEKQPDSIEKLIRSKCYDSIEELPIWNWYEIFRTNSLFYLLRIKKAVPKEQITILHKIYEEFYDAYLAEFGLNEKAQAIRELRQRYILNMAAVLQGDSGAKTFVDIDKLELDELLSETKEKQSIWMLKSQMEIALKINIDVKKCSVIEFYSY